MFYFSTKEFPTKTNKFWILCLHLPISNFKLFWDLQDIIFTSGVKKTVYSWNTVSYLIRMVIVHCTSMKLAQISFFRPPFWNPYKYGWPLHTKEIYNILRCAARYRFYFGNYLTFIDLKKGPIPNIFL